VKGDLVAEEAVVVESGARVVGDLRAPRIAIAAGALVRGHVQTAGAGAARPRAAAARAAAPAPAPARAAAETKSRPVAVVRSAPPPVVAERAKANNNHKPAPASVLAGARIGPPPPVVPVLKKGTKAVQKKQR
jgi:hypothetical protein